MKKAFLIFLPLLLSACAYNMHTGHFPRLEGKSLSVAVHHFGQPQTKIKQGAVEEIYIWTHDEVWNTYTQQQMPSISVIGKNVVYTNRMPPYAQNTYTWTCSLELTAKKGRILEARYWGDSPACDYFREKMKP